MDIRIISCEYLYNIYIYIHDICTIDLFQSQGLQYEIEFTHEHYTFIPVLDPPMPLGCNLHPAIQFSSLSTGPHQPMPWPTTGHPEPHTHGHLNRSQGRYCPRNKSQKIHTSALQHPETFIYKWSFQLHDSKIFT